MQKIMQQRHFGFGGRSRTHISGVALWDNLIFLDGHIGSRKINNSRERYVCWINNDWNSLKIGQYVVELVFEVCILLKLLRSFRVTLKNWPEVTALKSVDVMTGCDLAWCSLCIFYDEYTFSSKTDV